MALHHKSGPTDTVDRLRAILHATLSEASHRAESTTRVIGLAAYFVRIRSRLKAALSLFQEAQTAEDDQRVVREAQLLYLHHRSEFHRVENRSDLVRAWSNLLLEASEKIQREDRDAALYEADARAMDDDDREWYDATRRVADQR